MKKILKIFMITFFINSINAIAEEVKLNVNFIPGTAFLAKVCTKNGCSTERAVGQSHQDYLNVGDVVCVSVAGIFLKRYEYFFRITKNNEENNINFWGAFFYPKYSYDYNFIEYFNYKTNQSNFACSTWDFEKNEFIN